MGGNRGDSGIDFLGDSQIVAPRFVGSDTRFALGMSNWIRAGFRSDLHGFAVDYPRLSDIDSLGARPQSNVIHQLLEQSKKRGSKGKIAPLGAERKPHDRYGATSKRSFHDQRQVVGPA